MFLDPEDVDADGEWAAYWLASWSGEGPERHDSFYDLMHDLYEGFHALRKPPGETREHWAAEVERARLAALAGQVDEPLGILEAAERYGLERATLLRFQMLAMLGDWYAASMDDAVRAMDLTDPLFGTELLPLLFAEDRLMHHGELFTLNGLMRAEEGPAPPLIAEYQARLRAPGFRIVFGEPNFDAAVRHVVDRLSADPAYRYMPDPFAAGRSSGTAGIGFADFERVREARRRLADEAWPELWEAIGLWKPLSPDHIAPVVLFAHPILAEIITADRGRQILSMRRGDQ